MTAVTAKLKEQAPDRPVLLAEEMPPEMKKTVGRMLVRDALGFVRAGEAVLQDLDAQLRQIPNR